MCLAPPRSMPASLPPPPPPPGDTLTTRPQPSQCHAVTSPLPFGIPTAIVRPETLDGWELQSHSLVRVRRGHRSTILWLTSTDDFQGEHFDEKVPRPTLWLNASARRRLGIGGDGAAVEVEIPRRLRLKPRPAKITDLPSAVEADVSRATLAALGGGRGWVLLVYERFCMPVRLRERSLGDAQIRLAMVTRTLLASRQPNVPDAAGTAPEQVAAPLTASAPVHDPGMGEVLLCEIPAEDRSIAARLRSRFPSVTPWALAVGVVRLLARLTVHLSEGALRSLLLAPEFGFRTVEAPVGDDGERIIRLPETAFPMVGIRPGDEVVVEWADRRVVAKALEHVSVDEEAAEQTTTLQRVNLQTRSRGRPVLQHLTVGVDALIRSELGIPPHTVVRIRRRLITQVGAKLNELVVPMGGLLLAAAAIPTIDVRQVLVVGALVVLFAFFPLRYNRTPAGRFP